jgi:pyruvate/2-oxoglutarate dehydrogenase complex dihydrolipoamide acyltransferase (E2) component
VSICLKANDAFIFYVVDDLSLTFYTVLFSYLYIIYSDETVEVGAKLYELDTDAVASVSAPAVPAQATASSTPSKPAPTPSNDSPSKTAIPASDHRSPSIKFLGKDGWEALRKGHDTITQMKSGDSVPSPKKYAVTTIIDHKNVKDPMYGRPKFTESEMEALLTGGATLAPQVLSLSTGAKFKL